MAITKIATITVGAGSAASIDFTSIPGTMTDLQVVISGRTDRANTASDIYVQFNGVTTATYSFRRLAGNGSGTFSDIYGPASNGGFIGFLTGANATSSTFGSISLYIPNYAGSNAKGFSGDSVSENNATTSQQMITASIWSGTAAITSISIKDYNSMNFVSGSTATLYGVTKGSLAGVTVS